MAYAELFDRTRIIPASQSYSEVRPLVKWVFAWMGIGLLVTALVAFFTATSPALVEVRTNPVIAIGAMIGQIILVFALSFGMSRMSPGLAAGGFLIYSALMGFSLSLILLVFNLGTIFTAFGTTAILFGIMAFVGFTTQTDLTKLGRILFFALIGLIIATVVNLFVGWSTLNFIISVIGVLIFMGLTAYDVQNIKRMAAAPEIAGDTQMMAKVAIFGALSLYLNFINIFLFLLQLLGGSSSD
ncbi:MAG: Bax inhibitor-1/YccA family protein [Candidatus Flexifilum sp.]|jgi:FtsH-binding integral membrane protein